MRNPTGTDMSFILDALKKSENARQRQAGPALFEVKVAPPRRALPVWAIVIGTLLLINVAAVSWMLLRPSGARPRAAAHGPANAKSAAPPRSAPAGGPPAPATPRAAPMITALGAAAPATAPIPAPMAASPATGAGEPSVAPVSGAQAGSPQSSAGANPADFEPALPPPPGHGGNAAQSAGGLPLYAEISAAPGSPLPALHMDLHVYDRNPRKRFVMINMHKLRQGDSLPDGVTVVRIRPDGVVLSYQGRKFLLPR